MISLSNEEEYQLVNSNILIRPESTYKLYITGIKIIESIIHFPSILETGI